MRVVHVLWAGGIGGAERLNASLAAELRHQGVDARVLFVCSAGALARQLERDEVPYEALNLPRGSAVLGCPRRLARLANNAGADAAILVSVGYLGTALRWGGYRGKIIGVEHGLGRSDFGRRLLRLLDRAAAIPSYDAEVAVSEFMVANVRRGPHVPELALIPHGVTVSDTSALTVDQSDQVLRVGHLSRLVPGKGVDVAVRAIAALLRDHPGTDIQLEIAGRGPDRPRLEALVVEAQLEDRVRFVGFIHDVASFWADKDVGVVLDDHLMESFCIAALEAMACGKALVVSHRGALPELVVQGVTGFIADPLDPAAVGRILHRYAIDSTLRRAHGRAALQRANEQYSIERCAQQYLQLLNRVSTRPRPRAMVYAPEGNADGERCP